MVRKLSGKSKAASHQHLSSNFNGGAETKVTTKKDIADTLGDAFSKNSSKANYPEEFKNYQKHQEKIKLFSSLQIMKNIIVPLILMNLRTP